MFTERCGKATDRRNGRSFGCEVRTRGQRFGHDVIGKVIELNMFVHSSHCAGRLYSCHFLFSLERSTIAEQFKLNSMTIKKVMLVINLWFYIYPKNINLDSLLSELWLISMGSEFRSLFVSS